MVGDGEPFDDRPMSRIALDDDAADAPWSRGVRSLNPSSWSRRDGHDQGQLRGPVASILTIGGQRSVDGEGRLLHEGDTAAQLVLALSNLTDVVHAAGMTFRDVASLRIHTTDLSAFQDVQFVVEEHCVAEEASPPLTVVEVGALALPGLEIEIDGIAIANIAASDEGDDRP